MLCQTRIRVDLSSRLPPAKRLDERLVVVDLYAGGRNACKVVEELLAVGLRKKARPWKLIDKPPCDHRTSVIVVKGRAKNPSEHAEGFAHTPFTRQQRQIKVLSIASLQHYITTLNFFENRSGVPEKIAETMLCHAHGVPEYTSLLLIFQVLRRASSQPLELSELVLPYTTPALS